MKTRRNRWTSLLLPVAFTVLCPLIVQGQGGGWTNIGPGHPPVWNILFASQETGTIVIGSEGGGIRKSVDNGVTWSAANSGLSDILIISLAMDASGSQTLYAGTNFDGVYKTNDGGTAWEKLSANIGTVVNYLAADPNRPGVVYAGFQGGAIQKTSDGGATWEQVFTQTAPIAPIWSLAVDPRNSDVVYATTLGHGALKSVDAGQHWSPMSALTPDTIWTIALDPTDSRVIYAGTNDDGVWKSPDTGVTWQRTGSLGSPSLRSLLIDSSSHTIYAGTVGGGVWQSLDGGTSWQQTALSEGNGLSLAVDSAGVIYVGTGFGVQVSRDSGTTFSDLDLGPDGGNAFNYGVWLDPADEQKILLSVDGGGVIGTRDGGSTWAVVGEGFQSHLARQVGFDQSDSRRIYAGSFYGGGLYKSEDGGITWSQRRFGSPSVDVWAITVDAASPNIVYAGTKNDGLFRSTDYGDTWSAIGTGLPSTVQGVTLDPSNKQRIFAATQSGVFLSQDSGATWNGVLNKPAWKITIDSGAPSIVYITTRTEGIFRSWDGGSTWQDTSVGLTSLTMGRMAPVIIDPSDPQKLYVASEGGGGVSKSRDGGDHWFAINSGLDNTYVLGLAMDPSNPAVLYACGRNGVYRTLTGGEASDQSAQ